jgi:hypothetical protein
MPARAQSNVVVGSTDKRRSLAPVALSTWRAAVGVPRLESCALFIGGEAGDRSAASARPGQSVAGGLREWSHRQGALALPEMKLYVISSHDDDRESEGRRWPRTRNCLGQPGRNMFGLSISRLDP